MLFAQQLVSRLSHACKEFGLTISIKNTNVMAQDSDHPPTISIDGHTLEAVENFTYLRSTISSTLNIEVGVNNRIAKAAAVMARLTKRVWNNSSLTEKTRLHVYQACVLSTLLYGSDSWTTYAKQEKKLNSFHMRCLRRILHIHWEERVPDTEVRERANSMFAMLSKRRLHWLGHVKHMEPGRVPKDFLYHGELAEGKTRAGCPLLRNNLDTCKRDLKLCGIDIDTWEKQANDRQAWRQAVRQGMKVAEENRRATAVRKRQRRKEGRNQPSPHVYTKCNRDCRSGVGLFSHLRSWQRQ